MVQTGPKLLEMGTKGTTAVGAHFIFEHPECGRIEITNKAPCCPLDYNKRSMTQKKREEEKGLNATWTPDMF